MTTLRHTKTPLLRTVSLLLGLCLILLSAAGCAPADPAAESDVSAQSEPTSPAQSLPESDDPAASADESGETSEPEPEPEADFWDRNGQKRVADTWTAPAYCSRVEEGSPLYETGIRLDSFAWSYDLIGHYLFLFNHDTMQYRLMDLETGAELLSLNSETQWIYYPGEQGILYRVSPFTMEVRALRPDGSETVVRAGDATSETSYVSFSPFVTADGHFLLYFDEDHQQILLEDLETGDRLSYPSLSGISTIDYTDRESVFLIRWDSRRMRLYTNGEYLLEESEEEGFSYPEYSSGFRLYQRFTSHESCFLIKARLESDRSLYTRIPDPTARHWGISCGIMEMTTDREDAPFLFVDLRDGRCLQTVSLPGMTYLDSLAISEEGFALIGANVCGTKTSLFLYDLAGADKGEAVPTEELSDDDMQRITEEILTDRLETDGIEILYGSAGNDFLVGDYIGEMFPGRDIAFLNIRVLNDELDRYPDGMLRETWEGVSGMTGMRFYLCGSLYGVNGAGLDQAGAFATTKGNRIVIVFDCSSNYWTQNIPHELSHAFDHRIAAVCTETGVDWFEKFEQLTPYAYANSYADYVKMTKYTYDVSRPEADIWFIDAYARTFPTEDRARLMEYLFQDGDGHLHEYLEPEHIRYKVKAYCYILRKCFRSLTGVFPEWERYLDMDGFVLS